MQYKLSVLLHLCYIKYHRKWWPKSQILMIVMMTVKQNFNNCDDDDVSNKYCGIRAKIFSQKLIFKKNNYKKTEKKDNIQNVTTK